MANRRFIDFPIATTVGDSDIILIWQSGVNKQTTKATFLSGLPENLDELNDVAISGLTNGQILRYDSVTGKWENTDQGNLDLNDLNDVSIVSPSNGQVLVYNSSTSKWENSSGGFVPYTGAVTTVNLGAQTIQAGQFVKAGGTASQFLKADGSIDSTAYGTGSVTSVGLTMPSAFSVANSPVTTAGTLAVTGAGTVSQYIRGDGSLADFPEASGGGSSISYYLNGSINQGTIGGVAYKELSKVPILGAGTDFTINADGYIASFLTDAGDPNLLEIPGGNWNFETYFSASSGGGSPTFYVELYKYNGTTFTLLASNSTFPELIAFGTNITAYFSTLAVPTTTLALTDRLAIRYYVTHSGRTITLHTEDNHLCQIVTTFTTGLTALNGLTAQVQNFAVGTSGTDFNIASATATHTFNLPTASATNRGALSSADWTTFNNKMPAITFNAPLFIASGGSVGITQASGSTNGFLSSTDWTTFNNKQNALTNPVTGTGAQGRVAYWDSTGVVKSDSLFQWNDFSKRLGIGRTPTVSLDVEGAGFFSSTVTASSIIKSGGTSSQYLMADGSVSTLTNPVTGTGTTNYLPKFTGASTIGNSLFTDNGTYSGVGTALVGNARFNILNIASNPALSIRSINNVYEVLTMTFNETNDLFSITNKQAFAQSGIAFGTNNTQRLLLDVNGNVFVNSTSGYTNTGRIGVVVNGSTQAIFGLQTGGVNKAYLYNDGSNTLLYSEDSSGYLGFGTANTERARFTSGGNLLVGTTTDNGARLQVSGASFFNSDLFTYNNGGIFFSGMSAFTSGIFQNSNGLNLQSGGTPRLTIASTGAATFSSSVTATQGIFRNSGVPAIQVIRDLNVTVVGPAGQGIEFGALNGTTPTAGAAIYGVLDNPASTGSLVFQTLTSSSLTTKMTITSSGNFGIGTTSPAVPLDVVAGSGAGAISMRGNGSNVAQLYYFSNDGATLYSYIEGNASEMQFRAQGSRNLLYFTNGSERMRITSGGNVLIGTTTDNGDRLRVNGTTFTNDIMTWNPENDNRSGIAWRLGGVSNASITPNRRLRVNVGGVEYYIGAVEV